MDERMNSVPVLVSWLSSSFAARADLEAALVKAELADFLFLLLDPAPSVPARLEELAAHCLASCA